MLNAGEVSPVVQVAVKNMTNGSVFYFSLPVMIEAIMTPGVVMEIGALANAWKSIAENLEATEVVNDLPSVDISSIQQKLNSKDICFVTQRDVPGQEGQSASFFSCRTVTNASFIIELKFRQGFNACKITVKSPNKALSDIVKSAVARIISAR
jgi:hypothetical protein